MTIPNQDGGSTSIVPNGNRTVRRYQALALNGVATDTTRLANKDTIIVPQMSSLDLVARFDEPGGWMYHCHILEHAEGGMMGEIDVAESE